LFGFPEISVFVAGVTACIGETRKEYNIFITKLNGGNYLRET
jgi:hypothetical protein